MFHVKGFCPVLIALDVHTIFQRMLRYGVCCIDDSSSRVKEHNPEKYEITFLNPKRDRSVCGACGRTLIQSGVRRRPSYPTMTIIKE